MSRLRRVAVQLAPSKEALHLEPVEQLGRVAEAVAALVQVVGIVAELAEQVLAVVQRPKVARRQGVATVAGAVAVR